MKIRTSFILGTIGNRLYCEHSGKTVPDESNNSTNDQAGELFCRKTGRIA